MTGKTLSNRQRRNRRGVAGVIAGVFLIAILLTTVLVYFVVILKNDQTRAAYEIQSQQSAQEKAAEEVLVVKDDALLGCPANCLMTVHTTNEGSVPLVISRVLLYCTDNVNCPAIPGGDPNDPVVQGTGATLNAKDQDTRTVGPILDNLPYRVDVITERGNIESTVECRVDVALQVCIDTVGSSGPDFDLSAIASALLITPGTSATSTIYVTSHNQYSSPVTLSVSPTTIPGLTPSIPAGPVTPPPDGQVQSTLTIATSSTVAPGTYILSVTGDDGTLIRSAQVSVSIVDIDVQGTVTKGIIQGTGSLQLDFKSFGSLYPNWGTRDGVDQTGWNVKSGNATGYPGHSIPKHDRVVLVERMRNFDLSTEDLTLASQTGLSVTLGKAQGNSPTIVYICKGTPPVTPGTPGTMVAYDDSKALPFTPLTAGLYDNFQDVFFCSQDEQRKASFWNPAGDAKFEGINGIFMVARGYFGAKSDFYAQTIPYQSILISTTVNACLKTVTAPTGTLCPGFTTPQASNVDFKYFADDVTEMQGPLSIKMRLETTNHAPYNVEWVYPSSGKHVTLTPALGATPVNNHIQFNLPTTMEDGVTPIQPGFYTIIVASNYYLVTAAGKDTYQQDVHYMTFQVT